MALQATAAGEVTALAAVSLDNAQDPLKCNAARPMLKAGEVTTGLLSLVWELANRLLSLVPIQSSTHGQDEFGKFSVSVIALAEAEVITAVERLLIIC